MKHFIGAFIKKYVYYLSGLIVLLFIIGAYIWLDDSDSVEKYVVNEAHFGSVSTLKLYPDGNNFVTGGYDYQIKKWDLDNKRHVRSENTGIHIIQDLVISDQHNAIIGVGNEGALLVWDKDDLIPIESYPMLYLPVRSIEISDDERYLAGVAHNMIVMFQILAADAIQHMYVTEEAHETQIVGLFFDNETLISASRDGTVKFWDYQTGQMQRSFDIGNTIMAMDYMPNQKEAFFAVGRNENESVFERWNLDSEKFVSTAGSCSGRVLDLMVNPDGERLIVSCSDGFFRSLNLSSDVGDQYLSETYNPGVRNLNYSVSQQALLYRTRNGFEIIFE